MMAYREKKRLRVAALYDIHGNLPALEAVLAEIRQAAVDRIVVGGDVVPGPMAQECLALLLELPIPLQFLYGNCEVAVLQQMEGKVPAGVPEQFLPIMRWTAEQMEGEYRSVLAGWPKTVRLAVPGLREVLFCHGTPRDENEAFSRMTPEDRLLPIFESVDAGLVICGHTHMQFDRRVGNTRVVNAGSVGMPFGRPGADWLLLGPDVELRHTSYDLQQAAARIRQTEYPGAEEFATQSVLQPPSEEEMARAFATAGLKD